MEKINEKIVTGIHIFIIVAFFVILLRSCLRAEDSEQQEQPQSTTQPIPCELDYEDMDIRRYA